MPNNINFDFSLKPEQAIDFLLSKGLRVTWDWREMFRSDHDFAFTVAKEQRLSVLQYVKDALMLALEEGITYADFQEVVTQSIQEQWEGYRLDNIFRTNVLSAYQAGHYQAITDKDVLEQRPYWQYISIDDHRVRPEHHEWGHPGGRSYGITLPATDPWWNTHFPLNGFRCRCSVRTLSESEMQRFGYEIDKSPKIEYEDFKKADGTVIKVVKGIDPGFDHVPGKEKYKIDFDKFDDDIGGQAR